MENKLQDINDLVTYLTGTSMNPLLKDELWQCYGYKKRPKHGAILDRVFPEKYKLENYITQEVLTMGLIDILNGIKKSDKPSDIKLLISVGVVDQFLSTTEQMFPSDPFMENLFSTYASFLKSDKSKLHEQIIIRAKSILNKKDFATFMVGTIRLLAAEHTDDYLVKSDYITDIVNDSAIENKLKISMSEEMYRKYGTLLSEKIINALKT